MSKLDRIVEGYSNLMGIPYGDRSQSIEPITINVYVLQDTGKSYVEGNEIVSVDRTDGLYSWVTDSKGNTFKIPSTLAPTL